MADTVHILRHGMPLCGFSRDVPRDWPPGHLWVGLDDQTMATCLGCKAKLENKSDGTLLNKEMYEGMIRPRDYTRHTHGGLP